MKIAILIGVSEYITQNPLISCRNDVNLMNVLINEVEEYDEILLINEKTDSQNIKDELFGFIDKNKLRLEKDNNLEIDELFFYFSGHGMTVDEEFYYITSDFEYSKLNTTTLKNTEIDNAIRRLNPKLTVKIVDACESGTRYVKDGNNKNLKYLDASSGKFKDCYFMYSSHDNQNSQANKDFSFFTRALVESIINKSKFGNHRYSDILNYIADIFSDCPINQTPYFVSQASNLECFCTVTENLKYKLNKFILDIVSQENDIFSEEKENEGYSKNLYKLIKDDAENYCNSPDELISALNHIREILMDIQIENMDINELYKLKIYFLEDIDDIDNIENVAKLIRDNKLNYFVDFKYEDREFKVKKPIPFKFDFFNGGQQYKEELVTKRVISSYSITENRIPYSMISIDLHPKLPNISKFNCSILFAFSKSKITFFYSFNEYMEISWGEYLLPSNIVWMHSDKLIKDVEGIESTIKNIMSSCIDYVYKSLENKFISISE